MSDNGEMPIVLNKKSVKNYYKEKLKKVLEEA